VQRLNDCRPEDVCALERQRQQRVFRRTFHARPHRPPALRAVGPRAGDIDERHPRRDQLPGHVERHVVRHAPVAVLRHPGRGNAEAEKAGVVSGEVERVEVADVRFLQFRVLPPGRAAADGEDFFHSRIEEALAEYALSDHAGAAEEED